MFYRPPTKFQCVRRRISTPSPCLYDDEHQETLRGKEFCDQAQHLSARPLQCIAGKRKHDIITEKGAQVARKVLSGMVFSPPWDPIVHDVTRI